MSEGTVCVRDMAEGETSTRREAGGQMKARCVVWAGPTAVRDVVNGVTDDETTTRRCEAARGRYPSKGGASLRGTRKGACESPPYAAPPGRGPRNLPGARRAGPAEGV
ncbi:hypothetical protein GCM10010495_17230 [Kitasatospora herbaricolor]|nr:hypothetical protein GCM10010495_17230 [Kitasatospora herbaricolor]